MKWLSLVVVLAMAAMAAMAVEGLGVNWGTQATHKLPAKKVGEMLSANGIKKVKLFDADETTLDALAGGDAEVTVAIPNGDMAAMGDYDAAQEWVQRNVSRYNFKGGVNIKFVAVGNEPFLTSYNGTFVNITLPALRNIQKALKEAGLGDKVKAIVPMNADVYESPPSNNVPSAGRFRADIADIMKSIVKFLSDNNAPFMVNIYPFLSLYGHDDFPIDFAFFDGNAKPVVDHDISYTNVFDANFDTLYSALDAIGYPNITIVIGEVGWPTDGDKNANIANAARFYKGLLPKLANNVGSPRKKGSYIETYLFGLLDEDAKSVAPGDFERHWGIFTYDGRPKFPMDLSGKNQEVYLTGAAGVKYFPKRWCALNPNADVRNSSILTKDINYACAYADCTPLGNGSSCGGLDVKAKAAFAFNAYYQTQGQADEACDFDGLATTTSQNVSQGNCNFTIQIATTSSSPLGSAIGVSWSLFLVLFTLCLWV